MVSTDVISGTSYRRPGAGYPLPATIVPVAGPLERVGLCCINMDHGTPDDNLWAIFDVVRRYRAYRA